MFHVTPYLKKHQTLQDLYIDKGLSAAQVAKHVGRSKTWVIDQLKRNGIRVSEDRRHNPKNYRFPCPPFGYARQGNTLVLNRREMKIARLVVEWRERGQKSFTEIANLLNKKGYKNRRGKVSWQPTNTINIYKRWRGKL